MEQNKKGYRGVSAENTKLLTGAEVADLFGIAYADVIRMAKAGEIPSLKLGARRRRFPQAWLAVWIDNRMTAQGWRAKSA